MLIHSYKYTFVRVEMRNNLSDYQLCFAFIPKTLAKTLYVFPNFRCNVLLVING